MSENKYPIGGYAPGNYNPIGCEHKLPNGFTAWAFQSEEQSNLGGQHKVSIHVCLLCGEINIGGYRPSKDEKHVNSFHETFHIYHPDAIDAIIKSANFFNEEAKWERVTKPAGAVQRDETPIPAVDHDQAHINRDAGMPDFEAYYQAGFSNGHDIGYDKAKQEFQQPDEAYISKDSVEENWLSFWKEIVCNEDGTVNIEQVKKELSDFSYILEQVPKVYCHITGNRMSKVMYHADTVIGVADQYFEEQLEEAVKDEVGEHEGPVWVKDALKWSKEAIEFANKEFECPQPLVETWGNLYMNVLHAIDQALDESGTASNKDGETDHLIRQHAIAFMNWTLSGECDTYNCTDEDQWTNIYTQEVISTEQLHQLWQQSKNK